jgi:hypothetical protein
MVTSADNTGNAGISGPESNTGNANGSVTEHNGIAGAIDPDTARTSGSEGAASDDFAASFAEPAGTGAGASTTNPGEPRTKRKYTKRTQSGEQPNTRKEAPLNINGVEKILYSLHAFGSLVVPEMAIDETESKKLAKAIEGVTEQYKVTLDPKVAAYIDLATVCGMIYGPRAVAIYVRKSTEPKPQRPTATVHPIRPAPVPEATQARPQPMNDGGFTPGPIING